MSIEPPAGTSERMGPDTMSDLVLHDVDGCVFDAYGTLFDFASVTTGSRDRIGDKEEALTGRWRQKQLEYTWLRSLMGRHADFWQVTGEALDYAMNEVGLADPALRALLMQQVLSLNPYPDVAAALQRLKRAGMRTAVLSNG